MARPPRKDIRRTELVEAAASAVADRGLRSISLSDVARSAGLTRGAILYYFDDLEALLVEVHRAGIERFCDERDVLVAATDNPAEQLAIAIRAGLPSGPDDALMRLLYEFDVLAGTSELHDALVEKMYSRQLATYRTVLESGCRTGVFSPRIELETFAMNLVALEDAYGLHIVAGNSLITVATAEAAMRAAAGGLGASCAES